MIKLVIFDLDGVLVEAKEIHYESLNEAINRVTNDPSVEIGWEEHLSIYDGRKTTQKLEMLTEKKGLDSSLHQEIWNVKQDITIEKLRQLEIDQRLVEMFQKLSEFKIACCSNSIRKTVLTVLAKLGLMEYMDLIISNEDVGNSKPHPEMYWKAMSVMKVLPEETLIVEDSPPGLLAASRSRAHILRVNNPKDLTEEKMFGKLNTLVGKNTHKPKWQGNKMNVLIPMAGAGSRFQQAGYTFPKPLIDVRGKPMIQVAIDSIGIDATYTYVVQKEHRQKFNLDTLLNLITPNCNIVEVEGVTEGAACTTLLAKEFIDNDEPLLMANSDQFVEWNSIEFMYKMIEQDLDGGIPSFRSTHPKWSFAKINELGYVTEVAEKNPISDIATVGIYYWKRGSDYVKYSEQMIEKNIRVNNEFYVCPVYNEAIEDGLKFKTFDIPKMWSLGTPEDLNYFLENYG